MDAAEEAAKAGGRQPDALLPCNPAGGEQACARSSSQASASAPSAARSTATRSTALTKVYAVGAQGGGFAHGIELVIRAILQSPSFLYRVELGQKRRLERAARSA